MTYYKGIMAQHTYDDDEDGVIKSPEISLADAVGEVGAPQILKIASDVLRHSYDAEQFNQVGAYTERKRITFTNGIKGTLRIKFDIKSWAATSTTYAKIYKNGVALGSEQTEAGGAYATKTEDIDVGVLLPTEYLTLHMYSADGVTGAYVTNLRIYYDNVGQINVASSNS